MTSAWIIGAAELFKLGLAVLLLGFSWVALLGIKSIPFGARLVKPIKTEWRSDCFDRVALQCVISRFLEEVIPPITVNFGEFQLSGGPLGLNEHNPGHHSRGSDPARPKLRGWLLPEPQVWHL